MPDEQREPTEARVHELKTLPGFIDAIEESGKNFEVRINDRRFLTGDTLHLREFDPGEGYSGREVKRVVGYILDGFPGIESGYCVMALEPASPSEQTPTRVERLETAIVHLLDYVPTYGHATYCPMRHSLPQGPCECHIAAIEYAEKQVAHLKAAEMARASTHPEQWARVEAMEKALLWYADPDHWLDGQAGEWIVEEGNHVSGDGFAHNEFEHDNGERARAALEPAPGGEGEAS